MLVGAILILVGARRLTLVGARRLTFVDARRRSARGHRVCGLPRHHARQDVHGWRPHHDGRVRGDVIALGFLRTRILESLSSDSPDRPQELAGVQIFRIDVDRVLYRIRGFA